MDRAHWTDWGGNGPILHFAHANGFPSGTYRQLLEALTRDFHVLTTEARPLREKTDPGELRSWRQLAEDLTHDLANANHLGIIGVGHSLGGAMTFMAASQNPDLFSCFVAIDPLVLVGLPRLIWSWTKRLRLNDRFWLAQGALKRRKIWPGLDIVRRAYSGKRIFKSWNDGVLDDYVECGFRRREDDMFELRYPREWEARIFATSPANSWPDFKSISTPGLFIRGEHSDTFLASSARKIPRINPLLDVAVIRESSHFVAMERPFEVADTIREFARQQQQI